MTRSDFYWVILLSIAVSDFSCKETEKKINPIEKVSDSLRTDSIHGSADNVSYSKVEIYCWCFLKKEVVKRGKLVSEEMRDCTVPTRLEPSDLIRPEYLLRSIDDAYTLHNLQKLIFERKEKAISINDRPDARFVILLRAGNRTDTITYFRNEFIYNEKYLYRYSFNVMDSIRYILNVREINCSS